MSGQGGSMALLWCIKLRVGLDCLIRRSSRYEAGQDLVEYGLIMALISVAAMVVIIGFGPVIRPYFQDIINGIQGAS